MTNKTIALSRELAELYWLSLVDNCSWAHELRALLDADPMPPVGGDVEVLGYQVTRITPTGIARLDRPLLSKVLDGWEPAFKVAELVDRAHVTRLQAEVFEFRTALQVANKNTKQIMARRDALQSELTKARELQSDIHQFIRELIDEAGYDWLSTEAVNKMKGYLSNQSAPADKECAHRFMSLADDPRRCADCDAVEMHDKPVVRLELVRSGMSEGLHIRVWENLGNLWPGVHMLYLGPAEQTAPVAVVMPERMEIPSEHAPAYVYRKGWNACLDEVGRLNSEPKP